MIPLVHHRWLTLAAMFLSVALWATPCLAAPAIKLDPNAKPEEAFLGEEQEALKAQPRFTKESLRTYAGIPLSLPPGESAAYNELAEPEWYTDNMLYGDLANMEATLLRLAIRGNALAMAYMDLIYKLHGNPDSYFVDNYPNSPMMRKDFWYSWASRFVNPNWVRFEQREKEDSFATSYKPSSADGHPPSMYAQSKDSGVYRNYLLVASARMGYADAQYGLATGYLKGRMTNHVPDYENGMKYLALAAEQLHPEATSLYATILIRPESCLWIKPGHSITPDPLEGYKFAYLAKDLPVRGAQSYIQNLDAGRTASVTPEIRAEGKKLAEQWLIDFKKKQEELLAPERERRAKLLEEMHNELGEELVNELMGFSKSNGSGRWRESAK